MPLLKNYDKKNSYFRPSTKDSKRFNSFRVDDRFPSLIIKIKFQRKEQEAKGVPLLVFGIIMTIVYNASFIYYISENMSFLMKLKINVEL